MNQMNNKLKIIDNRYITIRKRGDGGFATVYKAWARNLERFVAIKEIHEELSMDAKFLDMFRDEAVNTAQLSHENIVRVIDFLKDTRNIYYIVMEYVKGQDMAYVLEKCKNMGKPIPKEIAIHIIIETLKALEHAHPKKDDVSGMPLNIVHRDISLSNIMLYYDGRIKLTDFGIAKAASSHMEQSHSRALKGKISYMSPEQAEGKTDIDNRSDLFSIGVVLYELITGKKPFTGDTDLDVWMRVKKARVDQSPLAEVTELPESLKKVIKKALERDPDKRYQSAAEMIADLQNCLEVENGTLKQNMTNWIGTILDEEIREDEQSSKKEREIVQDISTRIEEFTPTHETPSPIPQSLTPIPERESERPSDGKKDKTVFDFVLDTAKRYQRTITLVAILLLLGGVVFEIFDVSQRWTKLGQSLNDRIWPPALSIDTIPSGAKLTVRHRDKTLPLSGDNTTPLNIKKILPGNYMLILEKEGYKKIERKITVVKDIHKRKDNIYFKDKDLVEIKDAESKNSYLIPFEAEMHIDSNPSGADVYINGRKLPGKTPLDTSVEVGEYTIRLVSDGFEPLGNLEKANAYGQCNLNLLNPVDEQQGIDHRHWKLNWKLASASPGYKTYYLSGMLWKLASIDSKPSGAEIYIDDEQVARAITPISDLKLKAGKHKVRLAINGFQDWQGELEVTAEEDIALKPDMKKWIWFYSREKGKKSGDINARVYIKGTSINGKKTPFKYAFPLGKYDVTFKKPPRYRNRYAKLSIADSNSMRGYLQLQNPYLKVIVKDEITKKPIQQAYIFLNEKFEGRTDKNGVWKDYVTSGNYTIQAAKGEQYVPEDTMKTLMPGDRVTINMSLSFLRDATLIIDARDLYPNGEIYLNGEYIGTGFRKIEEIGRTKHTVTIKHPDLVGDLTKEVEFAEPEQVIVLTLVEEDGEPLFKLGIPTPHDAILIIDTRPDFPGAHIYLDGKYEGNTVRKISELSRTTHTLLIEHPELINAITHEIEFTNPDQTIILRIDEYGDIYIR